MFKLDDKKILIFFYGAVAILSSLSFQSKPYILVYLGFCFLLGWLYFKGSAKESGGDDGVNKKRFVLVVVSLSGLILAAKIIPFLLAKAPLGYDSGIYRGIIDFFSARLPYLPVSPGNWQMAEPWGLFLSTNLLSLVGWSTNQILYGYYIVLNLLLGAAVYVLVKEHFGRKAAICSLFLFAVSITQFRAFWMMYYKNILALFLMLMAFYLLERKSWLAVPIAGFLGAAHRPTFLIFGLAMAGYFLATVLKRGCSSKKKYIFISGLGILTVALSLYIYNPQAILNFLSGDVEEMVQTFGPDSATTGKFFFNFQFYRQMTTLYLPLAILGLIRLIQKRKFNPLFFCFIFSFIIVYFNLIFHNRFIIPLDIMVVVLSGVALSVLAVKFWSTLSGKAAVIVFLLGVLYVFGICVKDMKPLISNAELAEIESLSGIAKENDYVMAVTSYYSPWVYGFSGRKAITPRLFEYDKWSVLKWKTFWSTGNLELRHQLLDEYEKPLYVFIGDRAGRMDFSSDPAFIRISQRIWRYSGD